MLTKFESKTLHYYLDQEHRNKKNNQPFDFTGWINYTLEVYVILQVNTQYSHRTTIGYTSTKQRL